MENFMKDFNLGVQEYEDIIINMNKKFDYYNNMQFNNNHFKLCLANGDELDICIGKENVAHLLGLKIDEVKKFNFIDSSKNSYEILNKFLYDSYKARTMLDSSKKTYDILFSKYVNDKLDIFQDNINIRIDDIVCVIKYDSERTFKIENHPEISDYYIIRKINNVYTVLGIKKSDRNDVYKATSARKYDSLESLNKFIERMAAKQEITYPYLLNVSNYSKNYKVTAVLPEKIKREKLEKIIDLSNKFDCNCSVAADYLHTFDKLLERNNTENKKYSSLLSAMKNISKNITNGNIIDIEILQELYSNLEVTDELKNLIDTCNNNVSSTELSNRELQTNYLQLEDENQKLKRELEEVKQQLLEEKNQNLELGVQNNILVQENNDYKQDMNVLNEAYQKVFKK